jgi:hypothetical protein
MEDVKKLFADHPFICWGLTILLVLLVLSFITSERFVNRTVDTIAYQNPDPTLYKYTNRHRAPNGMSKEDYFLENDMTFKYGVGDELAGNAAFESRVITEGTILKDDDSQDLSRDLNSDEHFVGGASY